MAQISDKFRAFQYPFTIPSVLEPWRETLGKDDFNAVVALLEKRDQALENFLNHPPVYADRIDTFESTTSVIYTDLATVGPTVTTKISTTGQALVWWGAHIFCDDTDSAAMAWDVSGDSTVAVATFGEVKLALQTVDADFVEASVGSINVVTGLTPGRNIFTAKYKSLAGTSISFGNRYLVVQPL
jgi:hypothetical protein